jgi:hypothetical protein
VGDLTGRPARCPNLIATGVRPVPVIDLSRSQGVTLKTTGGRAGVDPKRSWSNRHPRGIAGSGTPYGEWASGGNDPVLAEDGRAVGGAARGGKATARGAGAGHPFADVRSTPEAGWRTARLDWMVPFAPKPSQWGDAVRSKRPPTWSAGRTGPLHLRKGG